jgi:5'-deoxynucleotidase YfbR-like HD superfamily hydrolase
MPDQDPNINWLREGIARIEKNAQIFATKTESAITKLSDKIDMYAAHFQTKDDARDEHARLEALISTKADREDVEKIQETITWMARLIIGAVIFATLSLIGLNI